MAGSIYVKKIGIVVSRGALVDQNLMNGREEPVSGQMGGESGSASNSPGRQPACLPCGAADLLSRTIRELSGDDQAPIGYPQGVLKAVDRGDQPDDREKKSQDGEGPKGRSDGTR